MPLKYPKIWSHELGETADVNELPETAEGTSGKASIRDLFPAITQVPLKAGGVAPARADFNALFKLLGDNIFFQQNGGVYIYSDKQNYYTNAIVWYQNKQYLALKDNGPAFSVGAKAPTDAGFWQEAIAPQLTPYTENEALIARALDKIGATSHAPVGTATATQLKTALNQILADLGAAAFLSKANIFNKSQTCTAVLPSENKENILVTYAQALDLAQSQATTPTGSLLAFAGTTIPKGFLLCNGAAVSRTTYAKLFEVIGTKWGSGDGSTTFNLPDFNDRFIEGTTDTTKVGKKLEAGLPNITGSLNDVCTPEPTASFVLKAVGCFKPTTDSKGGDGGGGAGNYSNLKLKFDAHSASSIFNSSITVQPKSNQALIIIKV